MTQACFALASTWLISGITVRADTPPSPLLPSSVEVAESAAEPAIRPLTVDEDTAKLKSRGAVVLGNHVLSAPAVKALRSASPALQKALDEAETRVWGPITEENARLTAAQAIPRYVDDANRWYDGTRVRGKGVVARRQEVKSDVELGDEHLGSAIVSIKFVSPWNVPFKDGQIEGINRLISKRLAIRRGDDARK